MTCYEIETLLNLVEQQYQPFIMVLVVVLGGVFGSFLTCMLYRVPRGISLSSPPSYCPSCQQKLKAVDLVPVLSYLCFKGRCHYCKTPVSPRYMVIELCMIAIFVLAYIMTGLSLQLIPALILAVSLAFVVGLWVESRKVATKVLLFSIMMSTVLYLLKC